MELWYAILLLIVALALLVAEFFIVSLGLLALAALAAAAGSIYFAFAAHDAIGWLFLVTVPLLAAATVRWGLRRIQQSHVVPQAEITADAGYHHVAKRFGIAVGSTGVMTTAARPAGRARFSGGECDVYGQGMALERDVAVVVVSIDGPSINVAPVQVPPSPSGEGEAEQGRDS
jgi:membrane-bound ClpP family serine protease